MLFLGYHLISDNKFVINCVEKAQCFNKYFLSHCKTYVNNSVLPAHSSLTNSRLGTIQITNNEIKSIIMSLNPNKTHGCGNISRQMLNLCAESIHIPLGIIFTNIVKTGIFPDQWKLANVSPIHKKNDKQLVSSYRPISLLPICSKVLEKIIFNNIYRYLVVNDLISKHQSGFRPFDVWHDGLLFKL